MNSATTNDVLNRLMVVHNRSLPMYLGFAVPWWSDGDAPAAELLAQIVSDQRQIVDRIGEMIVDNAGEVIQGEFPLAFTALHDLSFDFLLQEMLRHQERAITVIEQCLAQLPQASPARTLAEEVLGIAKAHFDALRELSPEGRKTTSQAD